MNINLSRQNLDDKESNQESQNPIQKDSITSSLNNSIKVNHKVYAPKKILVNQFTSAHNNLNISGTKTYYKKIPSSQVVSSRFSSNKKRSTIEYIKNGYGNKKEKLNMSYEGIKFDKIKNLLMEDKINNNSSNPYQKSNNYYAFNNCCYNLNNNNNILYEKISPSSDFLCKLNNFNTTNIMNKYGNMKLNNTYVNENLININNESKYNENINNINFKKNFEDILNIINLEDFIILEVIFCDMKESLSCKRPIINESFEYLNYYYNSSIYQNISLISRNIFDWNSIKIYLVYKLLSIIICYDCSFDFRIFEQTHLLLKEIIDLNYKNTIILYEYSLENIDYNNLKSNIWFLKLKNIINKYKNSITKNELNEIFPFNDNIDIPCFQKIKTNTNFIFNNINIILSNIKSKNSSYIKALFKTMNNISLQDIFHNYFKYILYIKNIRGSILGQTIINNNIIIKNNNIIPYIKTKNLKKYSLVIDLEETLLHFNKDNHNNEGYMDIRPGTLKFLDDISQYYELIAFNEGEKKFTDILIDSLEENKIYFEHRFYREHTIIDNNDIVKDLVRIGRDLDKILIIDNMKQNFKYQKDNGILIKSYFGEEEFSRKVNCNILEELGNILIKIAQDGGDIRKGLIKYKDEIINKVTIGNYKIL